MLNDVAPHLDETQRLLRESVAQFVARESDVNRARNTRREQNGFDPAVWRSDLSGRRCGRACGAGAGSG